MLYVQLLQSTVFQINLIQPHAIQQSVPVSCGSPNTPIEALMFPRQGATRPRRASFFFFWEIGVCFFLLLEANCFAVVSTEKQSVLFSAIPRILKTERMFYFLIRRYKGPASIHAKMSACTTKHPPTLSFSLVLINKLDQYYRTLPIHALPCQKSDWAATSRIICINLNLCV